MRLDPVRGLVLVRGQAREAAGAPRLALKLAREPGLEPEPVPTPGRGLAQALVLPLQAATHLPGPERLGRLPARLPVLARVPGRFLKLGQALDLARFQKPRHSLKPAPIRTTALVLIQALFPAPEPAPERALQPPVEQYRILTKRTFLDFLRQRQSS